MARIPMSSGFSVLPEGPVVLQIIESTYDQNFGKAVVKFQTADGKKHTEQYGLLDKSGKPNEGALGAYSIMAKNAMNDFSMESVDNTELVGHYIAGNITHTQNADGTRTYAHLRDMAPADGFPGQEAPAAEAVQAPAAAEPAGGYDLASLLGN